VGRRDGGLCALTAAGHDRVTAVIEWLAGTTDEERHRLRLPHDRFDGYRLPSESTIRRFLNETDDPEGLMGGAFIAAAFPRPSVSRV